MFDLPLTTDRLRLRRPHVADLDALLARRNDPTTARFQSWPVPVHADDAAKLLAGAEAMDGPQPGGVVDDHRDRSGGHHGLRRRRRPLE